METIPLISDDMGNIAVKTRLAKFNGIPKEHFELHLRETEFRFNNRFNDLYKLLFKMLRSDPI